MYMNNSKQLTVKVIRKRKMLLILPLLVLPFLTLGFWALGGGGNENTIPKTTGGLNTALPDARLKEAKEESKLSFYAWADRDSVRLGHKEDGGPFATVVDTIRFARQGERTLPLHPTDGHEAQIYNKLAQIRQQLATP